MPVDFTDTREYVAIKPIPAPSHVGLRITARSATPVYTCENPSRQHVAKENFERRNYQISSCGYRSVNFKPYQEVGEVILDEKELILKSLGQFSEENEEKHPENNNESTSNQLQVSIKKSSKEKEVITIAQPRIENLQRLEDQFSKGRRLMNKVKMGIGLFKLIKEEQNRKAVEAELERVRNEIESKTSMKPHNHVFDDENEEEDLSRFLAPTPSRTITALSCNEHESENNAKQLQTKSTESFARRNHRNANTYTPADVYLGETRTNLIDNEMTEKGSMDITEIQENREALSDDQSRAFSGEQNEDEKMDPTKELLFYQCSRKENMAKNKVNKSRKYKNSMPRPFSPIFTNVNFYETESREYTFRQLCALYWILEAMSQDQTVSMPPISTCWKLKDLKQDLHTAQWEVDRDKAVDPIWRTFLSNPKKFTRAKTGGRGALLQRRVSIAPNAIHRMSSLSSQHSGLKLLSPNEEIGNYPGTNTDDSKPETRSRSLSKLGMLFKREDDSPETIRRSQSRKFTLGQVAEDLSMQQTPLQAPSLKEKAFIVREVVVAKNVFGRRGSKMIKRRTSSTTQAVKVSTTQPKRNKKKQTENRSLTDSVTATEKDEKSPKGEGISQKHKILDADVASGSDISNKSEDENIPTKFKDKFEEVAAERALVLHDNLEERERTSVLSMERKFHSLHIMSDVNKAINIMRSKSRLKVETEEEKKARFSEECSWYKSLLDNLPTNIRHDRNNALVLDKIAKYGSLEGRKVSNAQFIKVLSLLRPWELCYPDISAAIEFVRDKIVEMDKSEFETWFNSRLSEAR